VFVEVQIPRREGAFHTYVLRKNTSPSEISKQNKERAKPQCEVTSTLGKVRPLGSDCLD